MGQAEDLDPQAKADGELIKWFASYGSQWQPAPFNYQVFAGELAGKRAIFLRLETSIGRIALPFTNEEAQGLVDHLNNVISGLQVVRQT